MTEGRHSGRPSPIAEASAGLYRDRRRISSPAASSSAPAAPVTGYELAVFGSVSPVLAVSVFVPVPAVVPVVPVVPARVSWVFEYVVEDVVEGLVVIDRFWSARVSMVELVVPCEP